MAFIHATYLHRCWKDTDTLQDLFTVNDVLQMPLSSIHFRMDVPREKKIACLK